MKLSTIDIIWIPIAFIMLDVIGKKMVKRVPWEWEHFYLGIELSLAALTSCFVNIIDLSKKVPKDVMEATAFRTIERSTGIFAITAIVIYLYILDTHHDWYTKPDGKWKRIMLAGLCNALGFGCLLYFLIWIKVSG